MRALLTILLVLSGGCDVWWAGFIGRSNLAGDGGTGDTADLAVADVPDLHDPVCYKKLMCPFDQYCDQNTGTCGYAPFIETAFPEEFASSVALNKHYVLMASGDYDGDQITDIAVSGAFSVMGGNANLNSVGITDVDIYRGNGTGGLVFDGSCAVSDKVTHLLTVPGDGTTSKANELLVATQGPIVYHCKRSPGGSWLVSVTGTLTNATGIKQLALANDQGVLFPDLVVRASTSLFPDNTGSGALDVYHMNPGYALAGPPAQFSTSDISWATVTPYHFGQTTGDTLALNFISKAPVGFQYLAANSNIVDQGLAAVPNSSGTPFAELNTPLRTTVLFRVAEQPSPMLVNLVSQSENWVTFQYGIDVAGFTNLGKIAVPASGIMLAYAGDAGEDGQDELGLYTIAPNATPMTRHLQIYAYRKGVIATAITDLDLASENFRGMAFGYLGNANDRPRKFQKKDLITLVEDPGGLSRIIIHRPNLNYSFP